LVTPVRAPQTALSPAYVGRHRRPQAWTPPDYRSQPFPAFRPRGGPPAAWGGSAAHSGYPAGLSVRRPAGQPRF
jgi:hypothetical protein